MKLSKLYASNPKFKAINFNPGFNVIYGDVEKSQPQELGTVQEHNLGKTSLVHLVDYMLLKVVDQDSYLVKFSEKFLNWVFFLEIELNDGSYVTIRRAIGSSPRVSMKAHFQRDQNYIDEDEWDYSNLSIYAKKDSENPIRILESKFLKFDVHTEYSYRSFLSYILRTQYDYVDVFKLNKFQGSDDKWKPQLFNLLGFDQKILNRKYVIDTDINALKKVIKALNTADTNDGEKYKIRAAIATKEDERLLAQKNIDSFNFYQEDDGVNSDLVKNVEQKIALLNDNKYTITYDIDQVQQSLDDQKEPVLEIADLEEFFTEIGTTFPNSLKKNYEEVLVFSKQLNDERHTYLRSELIDLQNKLKNVNESLKSLNSERVEMLKGLKEKDSFRKYKTYQHLLTRLDNEIFEYKQSLRDIERTEAFVDKKKAKLLELDVVRQQVTTLLDNEPDTYKSIRKRFKDIYKEVFEYTATLVVKVNDNGNVIFEPLVLGSSKDMTGKSDGYTSKRVMCASFVLAVMATYSDRSFFRFAYNDGIMEGWGDNHKISFINVIRSYCEEYGLQFITSVIKSDVPVGFEFNQGEVVRTLSKNDTLFNVDF